MAALNPPHEWHKSSYSQPAGDNCVECASASWSTSSYSTNSANCVECTSATWAKSSYSTAQGQDCVEYTPLPTSIAVRDSKHPDAGHLDFPGSGWAAFLGAVKDAALDV
ncbi:DUF397 domain-containing protein [Streptomonospora litoralis]|uniref:DUF397 domain-containing protein n=1 Tax=Streptomonospora litoralis TaxID=2498135 RepID=A0A4P6Q6F9_9ACTN|nr:DUF397 domain-containing protein [Streptomonospora litoralis]QBI56263.1 hypothetical protein EKD16_22550 [Streptomonospora litoralis]